MTLNPLLYSNSRYLRYIVLIFNILIALFLTTTPSFLSAQTIIKPNFKSGQSFELFLKQINHNRDIDEYESAERDEDSYEYGNYDFPQSDAIAQPQSDFYDSFAAKGTLKVLEVSDYETLFSYQRTKHNVGFILGDLIMQTTGNFNRLEAQNLMESFLQNNTVHFKLSHKPGSLPQLIDDSLAIHDYLLSLKQLISNIDEQQIIPALELIESMSEAMLKNNRPDLLIHYPERSNSVQEEKKGEENEIFDFMKSYVYTMVDIFMTYQEITLQDKQRFLYTLYPELALFFNFHHQSIDKSQPTLISLPVGTFTNAYYSGIHTITKTNKEEAGISIESNWFFDQSQKNYFRENLLLLLQNTYEKLMQNNGLNYRVDPLPEFGTRPMDAKGNMSIVLDPKSYITREVHREIEALTLDGNIHVSLILSVN